MSELQLADSCLFCVPDSVRLPATEILLSGTTWKLHFYCAFWSIRFGISSSQNGGSVEYCVVLPVVR
jgi:hypothetical protein